MIDAMPSSLTSVDSSALVAVGTRTFVGANEYVYLKGVADVADGSWVTYDEDYQAALLAANAKGPVAVAQAAVVANKYGWFLINGLDSALVAASFADNGDIYATATAGTADDAVVAGDRVKGAWGRSAISSGKAEVELRYPFMDDIAD